MDCERLGRVLARWQPTALAAYFLLAHGAAWLIVLAGVRLRFAWLEADVLTLWGVRLALTLLWLWGW